MICWKSNTIEVIDGKFERDKMLKSNPLNSDSIDSLIVLRKLNNILLYVDAIEGKVCLLHKAA